MGWLHAWWAAWHPATIVTADRESIAAGRDIITTYTGLNEQEVGQRLTEATAPIQSQLAVLADQIAREKGIPARALQAILTKLGEANIKDEEIPNRLEFAADELIELRKRLANDRPGLAAIRARAAALIERGEFDSARAILDQGREVFRQDARVSEAELLLDAAQLDHLQLRYRSSAEKFGEAAAILAPFSKDGERFCLKEQASQLMSLGGEEASSEAIDIYKRILGSMPSIEALQKLAAAQEEIGRELIAEWADIRIHLGLAVANDQNAKRLEEAVAVFRETLEVPNPDQDIIWFFVGQFSLKLYYKSPDTEFLARTIVAYKEALKGKGLEGRNPIFQALAEHDIKHANWLLDNANEGFVSRATSEGDQ